MALRSVPAHLKVYFRIRADQLNDEVHRAKAQYSDLARTYRMKSRRTLILQGSILRGSPMTLYCRLRKSFLRLASTVRCIWYCGSRSYRLPYITVSFGATSRSEQYTAKI